MEGFVERIDAQPQYSYGISVAPIDSRPIKLSVKAMTGGIYDFYGNFKSSANTATPELTVNKCRVTVLEPVASISLNRDDAVLDIGAALQLGASFLPESAYPRPTASSYTWTSSNSSVAAVSASGRVTAHAVGTTRITASYNSKTDYCLITVTDPKAVTGVSVSPATLTINAGSTGRVTASVKPSIGNQSVTWSSSNTSIAAVASDGTITGVSAGVCDITARTAEGGFTAPCRVTVNPDPSKVTGVSVSPATISLYDGAAGQLAATVSPTTAANKNVTWTSSSASVASVNSSGVVTGVAQGTCYIYARTAEGGFTASAAVTVTLNPAKARSVSISPATLSLYDGASGKLTATVLPSTAANKNVTWSSGNNKVAAVDASGVVTGIAPGTCTITAKTADGGYTGSATVTVTQDPAKARSVTVSPTTLNLYDGAAGQLTAAVSPTSTSNKSVTWTTSNNKIATVNASGLVTGIAPGTCTITVKTADGGYTAAATVKVTLDPAKARSVTVAPAALNLYDGAAGQLTAAVSPASAANKNVTWSASDNKIAAVNASGLVTGIAPGTCTITAKTADGGYTASATVTVTLDPAKARSITVTPAVLNLYDGKDGQLTAAVLPASAANKAAAWTSSNTGVATVNSLGLVTGIAPGTCTITARTDDGGYTASASITVTLDPAKARSVSVTPAAVSLYDGAVKQLTAAVLPETAADKSVNWSSSNNNIAAVDEHGAVTGISPGTCNITAQTSDGGHTARASVTVTLDPSKARAVTVTPSTATLQEGQTMNLTATVSPDTAADKSVTWASNDEAAAVVDEQGTVTGIAEGDCVITATAADGGYTSHAVVTVLPLVAGISVFPSRHTIVKGDALPLLVTIEPSNAYDASYVWEHGDPSIAALDPAIDIVTATGNGTTTFTAVSKDGGFRAEAVITVITEADGFYIEEDQLTLPLGETHILSTVFIPEDTTDKTVDWISGAPSVASVDAEGRVTAHTVGRAVITGTTRDGGFTDACVITAVIPVTGVTLSDSSTQLPEYQSAALTAAVLPSDATNQQLHWSSSNPSVATVDSSGIITSVSLGFTTITATAEDGGFTASCEVWVITPVDGVYIKEQNIVMNYGATMPIHAVIVPEDATIQNVRWFSSDTRVAEVAAAAPGNGAVPPFSSSAALSSSPAALIIPDPGGGEAILTAVNAGEAVITVTSEDGMYAGTTKVTVVIPVTGIRLSAKTQTMIPGTDLKLSASVLPSDATNQRVYWSSDNPSVASVDSDGNVTSIRPGQAVITATTDDGAFADACAVDVTTPVTGVTLSDSARAIYVGSIYPLKAVITPADATNKAVVWTSGNPYVAAVDDNGVITGISAGRAEITVRTEDGGFTAKCVVDASVRVTGITLTETSRPICVGDIYPLKAVIEPADATNKSVRWTSSNPRAAVVDANGVITGVSTGRTVITAATEEGGYTAKCVVDVSIPVTGLTLSDSARSIYTGDTYQLRAVTEPADATNREVRWSSEDARIAAVDANGLVTGVSEGRTVITVTNYNGAFPAQCVVDVSVRVTGITLSDAARALGTGESYQLKANITPANATNKVIHWTSSNPSAAAVDANGVIKGIAAGQAVITARTEEGGYIASCTVDVTVRVTGVTLLETEQTLYAGGAGIVHARIQPANAANQKIHWSSSNPRAVAVDANGALTCAGAGEAVITAETDDGGFTAKCTIRCFKKADGIQLSPSVMTMRSGEFAAIEVITDPDYGIIDGVFWTSDNPKAASVNFHTGEVYAAANGSAVITATANNSTLSATCVVTVITTASYISVTPQKLQMRVKEKQQLTAAIQSSEVSDKTIRWTSGNSGVATVNAAGLVTAVSPGRAAIFAENGGKTASASVEVLADNAPELIEIQPFAKTLAQGEKFKFTASVKPDGAKNPGIVWTSADSGTASVNKTTGEVTAVKAGKTSITATTADGALTASAAVEVTAKPTEIVRMLLVENAEEISRTIAAGDMLVLSTTYLPPNLSEPIKSGVSNAAVASLNDRIVVGKAEGKTDITFTTAGGLKAVCHLTVTKPFAKGITINGYPEYSAEIDLGKTLTLNVTTIPASAYDPVYSRSENSNCVSVSGATIKGISSGKTDVTFYTSSGAKGVCHVTVNSVKPLRITRHGRPLRRDKPARHGKNTARRQTELHRNAKRRL
jgi:uncharacterized protein YjdB